MSVPLAIEWTAVALLAAVVLGEGIRRIPPGALVIRSVLLGPWTIARERSAAIRVASLWPPLTRTLVLAPSEPDGSWAPPAVLPARLGRVRRALAAAHCFGLACLVGVVLGIPAASATLGAVGLLAGLAGVLLAALGASASVWIGLGRLEWPRRSRWRVAAGLLSPFAAPGAGERLLACAVGGVSPVAVARALLPSDRFGSWVRPAAYELARGGDDHLGLRASLSDAEIEAMLAAPAGARYCARCGQVYTETAAVCADCDGLPLSADSYQLSAISYQRDRQLTADSS